jgi:hypothetical protein
MPRLTSGAFFIFPTTGKVKKIVAIDLLNEKKIFVTITIPYAKKVKLNYLKSDKLAGT